MYVCSCNWEVGALGVYIGRVGPVKDSLTYCPSSQGWAPRVLPLMFCVALCVFGICAGVMGEIWFSVFPF